MAENMISGDGARKNDRLLYLRFTLSGAHSVTSATWPHEDGFLRRASANRRVMMTEWEERAGKVRPTFPDGSAPPDPASERTLVQDAKSLDAKTTYEVILEEGEQELARSTSALVWSGLAAGLTMGLSFLSVGLLHAHLPESEWRPLVARLGYTVGFVAVIIGSQQLFTENTLTPILPLLKRKSVASLRNVLRLWGAVFLANMVGSLVFALALGGLDLVDSRVHQALEDVAREALRHDAATTFVRAVAAGWLIALLVWMLPGVKGGRLGVIVLMTYLIALGGFAHVIAGASEVFYAAIRGAATWGDALAYLAPTLVGNVLGGVTLVTALNHAQATSGES
jgi:formate-nitrite transporter family protein